MWSVEDVLVERAEVQAVLSSAVFSRAPNLTKILRYVCEEHFEGRGDQIKEYNIAVDALRRPPDFDQKKDSIVRVEAYKLRKRLKEFYRSEGLGHPVQIEIPNGQYAPVFVRVPAFSGEAAMPGDMTGQEDLVPVCESSLQNEATLSFGVPATESLSPVSPTRRYGVRVSVAAVILICGVALTLLALSRRIVIGDSSHNTWNAAMGEVPSDFRILAGYYGPPVHDRQGRTWQADAFYSGGISIAIPGQQQFECSPDSHVLQAIRAGDFRYDIPVRAGTYEIHLYFVEPAGSTGSLSGSADDVNQGFTVEVNGKALVRNLDLLSEAGSPHRMLERVFRDVERTRDGKIHLAFRPVSSEAVLTAMEILADAPGRVRPIRIVTRKASLIDTEGTAWSADEYFSGGRMVERRDSVRETPDKTLYEGERFGNFTYFIPAAPGSYHLTLYFAETYWGTALPYAGGNYVRGSRTFNVFVNGEVALRNFEVAETAGGTNRGIKRTFSNVQPNAQGRIVIEFSGVSNYAEVNALELVAE